MDLYISTGEEVENQTRNKICYGKRHRHSNSFESLIFLSARYDSMGLIILIYQHLKAGKRDPWNSGFPLNVPKILTKGEGEEKRKLLPDSFAREMDSVVHRISLKEV